MKEFGSTCQTLKQFKFGLIQLLNKANDDLPKLDWCNLSETYKQKMLDTNKKLAKGVYSPHMPFVDITLQDLPSLQTRQAWLNKTQQPSSASWACWASSHRNTNRPHQLCQRQRCSFWMGPPICLHCCKLLLSWMACEQHHLKATNQYPRDCSRLKPIMNRL